MVRYTYCSRHIQQTNNTFFSNRFHIPRLLSIAICIYGVSGLIGSLPHLISSHGLPDTPSSNITRGSIPNLCQKDQPRNASIADDSCSSVDIARQVSRATWVVGIFVFSMIVQGIGKSPRSSLGTLYLDNNGDKKKTGLYVGK